MNLVVVKVDFTLLITAITIFKAAAFPEAVTALEYAKCSFFKGQS